MPNARVGSRAMSLVILALGGGMAACGTEAPTQPSADATPPPSVSFLTLASNTWTPKAAYPVQDVHGFSVGVVPNSAGQPILYAFGGTDGSGGSGFWTLAYNAATNAWTRKNTTVDVRNSNGVVRIKGKLYFSGGYIVNESSVQASTWAYDPRTDQLTRKADMPKYTADGVSGMINDRMYVLPGICSTVGWPFAGYCDHEPFQRLFLYDPATNVWVSKKSAPHYHRGGAGGVINGKFYVVGGFNGFQPVAYLDVYDPAANSWKTLAPVPSAGRARGAVISGKLYVLCTGPDGTQRRTYAYNPVTNTWATKAVPPSPGEVARVDLDGGPYLLSVSSVASGLYKP